MKFSNTYIQLDPVFYQMVEPTRVVAAKLFLWNEELALSLKLSSQLRKDRGLLAEYFSGNLTIPGAQPIALAYAGHQFGHFNPQLGDGRAHLLGEVIDTSNVRRDIQLKGSGPTRFSRGGDGRCALKPALREFIMSEAMFALGVPTSRCLAVVGSGENVYRDRVSPGAVVTRVATSHIRVGTFQYFAARGDIDSLKALTRYAIARHFPKIEHTSPDSVVQFLQEVINKQIKLIVEWMRVGFIHGVMNTDNTAISGETIDFGPCAMLGNYAPDTVFSSIDTHGRYAFGNQGAIAQWNMARLAECLLTLIDSDGNKAVEKVEPMIRQMAADFEQAHMTMIGAKLGISELQQADATLCIELLAIMHSKQLDYTQTFALLTRALQNQTNIEQIPEELQPWYQQWYSRIQAGDRGSAIELMKRSNPIVIPRNHHVEAVLEECELSGSADKAEEFLQVLASPYQALMNTGKYQGRDEVGDRCYKTYCGT
jgi:serine/tyrosine/threonine adenylyltransferase